jgi:hypothetical protein
VTWALLDDHANEHPKVLQVGAEAAWLWVCGLMYCRRNNGSHGVIPAKAVRMLYPFDADPNTLAARLVESGLWHETPSGYQIHEYEEWCQKGKKSVESASRGERRGKPKTCPDSSEDPVRRLSGQDDDPASGQSPDLPVRSVPYRTGPIRTDPVDDDRTTTCPLDLAAKLPATVVPELAAAHRVSEAAIRQAIEEFVTYWTVGGGAGTRRKSWPRTLRQRIHELAKRGDLVEPAPKAQAVGVDLERLREFNRNRFAGPRTR